MTPIQQLMLGVGASKKTYMEDVFSTYLYTGNGTAQGVAQQIVNGVDNTEGGLVWIKGRTSINHMLLDTERVSGGLPYELMTDTNQAQAGPYAGYNITVFNNNGFKLEGGGGHTNNNGTKFISWNFRKAKGFFDIVTYTGNGTAGRTIAHSLGCVPGLIMIKRTDAAEDWAVYHRELGGTKVLTLNENSASNTNSAFLNDTEPTASVFSVGTSDRCNKNTGTYVAYVFAGGASTASEAKSLYWADDSDKLKCGDSSNTTADFNFGTGDLTIECWIKCNSTQDGYPRLVAIGPQWAAGQAALQWDHTDTANKVTFYCYNYSSSGPLLQSAVKGFNGDGQWHHVAVSRNGNTWRLFVDGILENTATWSGSPNSANSYVTIGMHTAATAHFTGHISNVRIVKGTAAYTSSFKVPTKPLTNITNTKLLCCNSSSITGATVTPITLTEASLAAPTSDSPFDDPDGFKFGEEGGQNVIKCGSYVGNGDADGPEINLGWEPQYILVKDSAASENWKVHDSMRGIVTGGSDSALEPNDNGNEGTGDKLDLTPTGFKITTAGGAYNTDGNTHVFLAIRRPDPLVQKLAEAGTDVFAMDTGASSSTIPNFDSGFPVDFAFDRQINGTSNWDVGTRLTQGTYLNGNTSGAEGAWAPNSFDSNVGWNSNSGNNSNVQSWMWKRHAGFDVVTFDGVSGGAWYNHGLNRVPEMIWIKDRSDTQPWQVYHHGVNGGSNPENYEMVLNTSAAQAGGDNNLWGSGVPTSTHFRSGLYNRSGANTSSKYIALLFSSVSGICKVGSFTGSASAQTITTGFQPRFVIIKTYNQSQAWIVLDTTRGWGSGDDKYLNLASTGAQTTYAIGAPTSTGFTVPAEDNSGLDEAWNHAGYSYIYYAHA